MARLYRPHVPLSVRCQVAERQIAQATTKGLEAIEEALRWLNKNVGVRGQAVRLQIMLKGLAGTFECEVKDLRLDHDPPLGAREKVHDWITGEHTGYIPDANSPDHLKYRPHGSQFEESHDVKTRIRGDHGQFSDIALIKRQRRREKAQSRNGETRRKTSGFPKPAPRVKRVTDLAAKLGRPKPKWPSRPFPKKRKER